MDGIGQLNTGSATRSESDVLTIEEAARYLKIGRTKMCALLATGEVESVYIGRLRRVPVECLRGYVKSLLDGTRSATEVA